MMNPEDITREDIATLQRKLTVAGYLKSGMVSEDADWQFDFSRGKELILIAVRQFLRDLNHDLTEKDVMILGFMLDHTNKDGFCAGNGPEE